ncbi:hypothetical protein SBADM41S_06603 [Streptomyces badius]
MLGVLLPYVAVVIANAGRENATSLPTTFVPMPMHPALEAGSAEPGDAGGVRPGSAAA